MKRIIPLLFVPAILLAQAPQPPAGNLPDAESARILADDSAAPAARVDAAIRLASDALGAGDFETAEKHIRTALAVKGLAVGQIGKLVGQLGRLRIARNDLDGAIACYFEAYALNKSPAMTNAVVALVGRAYSDFFREKEGIAYCEKHGAYLAAADLCRTKTFRDDAERLRLCRHVLDDETQSLSNRRGAYERLFMEDPERADRYFATYVTGPDAFTNGAVRLFGKAIASNGDGFAFYGDYPAVVRTYEKFLRPILDGSKLPIDYKVAQYVVYAYCGLGRFDDAAAAANRAAETSPDLPPAERHIMRLSAAVLPLGEASEDDLLAKIRRLEPLLAGDLPPDKRALAIQRAGSAAMIGNREELVRALEDYRKSLYAPMPKKRYTVRFSERPVLGADSWGALPFQPEVQPMDREFGGNMEFLKTDVATGDRGDGVGEGVADKADPFPTLSAVADAQGLHFRFFSPNPRALDVERGLAVGGSYEGYIAPGANQPYICFLVNMSTGGLTLYNTAYDSPNHRRVETEDTGQYRAQVFYREDGIVTYFMLSWDTYATLIPEDGAVWDFENINWKKPGSAAWNGTESIHGRSTWGELVFEMPEKARAAILRRIVFRAIAEYNSEKKTSPTKEGVLDHWGDPAVGDPVFYEKCLAPLVEKLDDYAERLKPDASDEEVLVFADKALPEMRDIRFVVERLRARYLRETLR
ncbi:MAG: hypothetical protein IJK04_00095 [Kiritimatiellae bacterium]|nr:hypothetical protein [Kiritimatiellia bacterium]